MKYRGKLVLFKILMKGDFMSKTDKELTTEIVTSFLANTSYNADEEEITGLIKAVHETLKNLD